MTLKSLEDFDKDNAAKRERLLKDHAIAHALPTNGKLVTWIGEGGWEKDGNTRKPDVARSIDVAPWIVHGPFRGAEHVAYKAPDSLYGDKGEHDSSKPRAEFVSRYFAAVLDAFEPFTVSTLAIKGRYASHLPETFDYRANKDYADAKELARGLYEVTVSSGAGYTSAKLAFFANVPDVGPLQVSFDVDRPYGAGFQTHKLHARCSSDRHGIPRNWNFPSASEFKAVNMWKRANSDRNQYGVPSGYTLEWLFATREDMERAIGARK
jgi:hypothetical protein